MTYPINPSWILCYLEDWISMCKVLRLLPPSLTYSLFESLLWPCGAVPCDEGMEGRCRQGWPDSRHNTWAGLEILLAHLCKGNIYWENSRGLLLVSKVPPNPGSYNTLFLREIRQLCPNTKWSIGYDRMSLFFYNPNKYNNETADDSGWSLWKLGRAKNRHLNRFFSLWIIQRLDKTNVIKKC